MERATVNPVLFCVIIIYVLCGNNSPNVLLDTSARLCLLLREEMHLTLSEENTA